MCAFAKLGGTWGMPLSRATFSVMLKFSDSLSTFTSLIKDIDEICIDFDDSVQG